MKIKPFPTKVFFLLFLFLPALLSGFHDELTVYIDAGNYPFMYGKDGAAFGLYPAIVREAFKRMNVPVKILPAPWSRALYNAETGLSGVAGIYKNTSREKIFDYSDPVYEEELMIFVRADRKFIFNAIRDLGGMKIGVLKSWSYGDEFDSAVRKRIFLTDAVGTDELNFLKLDAGRTDCAVAIRENGLRLAAGPEMKNRIVMLPRPVAKNKTYLIFPKSMNKKKLLSDFSHTVAGMKKDGTFDRIARTELSAG